MFELTQDGNMRLSDSIIRYQGKPIYVEGVAEDRVVIGTYLDGSGSVRKTMDDRDWDPSPVPTGYVNREGRCYYVCRRPTRRWKQGLHRDNVEVYSYEGSGSRGIINSAAFADTVLGNYPTLEEVLDNVRSRRWSSGAWTRKFALCREEQTGLLWLMHRNNKVGWVQDNSPVLGENAQYLVEELQEAVA